MKARSLVSCILLSILLIHLLTTAVQATEYSKADTEVKAEEILKHIENGDDIALYNCSIVGELDASKIELDKIELEPIQNPIFDEFEFNKNLSAIENNITITNSIFENDLDFSNVLFNNSANFSDTRFNNSANFSDTRFNSDVHFYDAKFNSYADFCYAEFNSSADFSDTIFNSDVYFSGAKFNSYADFCYAEFNSSADFSDTIFISYAEFSGAIFNSYADFGVPETSENIFTDRKACEFFRNSYNNEARYSDADNIYYNYRKSAQDEKELTSFSKWIDILSWVTCGYGVRLSHTIGCIISILVVFSILYGVGSIFYPLSDAIEKKENISYLEPVLLSIRGFTTLGSGDWYSRNNHFKALFTLEGLLGWIMLGIFMATLTSLLIKS